jgi:hypothetical protein
LFIEIRGNAYSMSTIKEDKKKDEIGFNNSTDIPRITADFQCFVCGAVFTSDEDRKQHLEKEALGQLRDDETAEDIEIAKNQEELNERHPHHI